MIDVAVFRHQTHVAAEMITRVKPIDDVTPVGI
jgi:hypothetical protein